MKENSKITTLDIEGLLDRYGSNFAIPRKLTKKERTQFRKDIEPVWNQYLSIPLTLQIDDVPVRRLCQTLTDNGYTTFSSCEGHGREVPHIFFRCRKPTLVAELSYILRQESSIKNLGWAIQAEYQTSFYTNRLLLYYALEPREIQRGKPLDPKEDYGKIMEDFDILGFCIFNHFLKK